MAYVINVVGSVANICLTEIISQADFQVGLVWFVKRGHKHPATYTQHTHTHTHTPLLPPPPDDQSSAECDYRWSCPSNTFLYSHVVYNVNLI